MERTTVLVGKIGPLFGGGTVIGHGVVDIPVTDWTPEIRRESLALLFAVQFDLALEWV